MVGLIILSIVGVFAYITYLVISGKVYETQDNQTEIQRRMQRDIEIMRMRDDIRFHESRNRDRDVFKFNFRDDKK